MSDEPEYGYCMRCGKPAGWERYGYTYCSQHQPLDEEEFDPEAAELDVIAWFERGGVYA